MRTIKEIEKEMSETCKRLEALKQERKEAHAFEFEQKFGVKKGDTIYSFDGKKYRYLDIYDSWGGFIKCNPTKKDGDFSKSVITESIAKFSPETIHGNKEK